MPNGRMSASQALRELIRRDEWLKAKSLEGFRSGQFVRPIDREIAALAWAIPLVKQKAEENLANHEDPR